MKKISKRVLSALCALALLVGLTGVLPVAADETEQEEQKNLYQQIMERDGYLEGVWFPWFTHDNLGHGLTDNETMMKWAQNQWYDFSTVGLDAYGAAKVYQEIYNLKVMGFNIMAYAGSAYGEGVIYDDNGDVLGIKKEYLLNVRRFLDMCRQIDMPLLWNICFHSSSVPDYYGMEPWWIINAMYCNPTIADHYAERFVRPLCQVLAEYPDVIAIVALTDEIENETNDSDIGNLFSGGRAMYGTTLANVQYFVSAMNDVVKEEMPDVARTVAVNNKDKARYGDLDLDLNGQNTYNNDGNISWPEEMVANAPVFLSEYNIGSSSNHSEAEMTRRHVAYRDNMKLKGLVGGFMWAWQPSTDGNAHNLLAEGATSMTDFREFVHNVRHYAIDSRNQHRGTTGAMDAPELFYNLGRGWVEWVPSRQATKIDLLSSTNGGNTWTTLLSDVPQSDYLQGFKCVYKDRRATSDTIYKIVARDDAGNTVESAISNHPDDALPFVQNVYTTVVGIETRPTVSPAETAVSGGSLTLTSFAVDNNRPLIASSNVIKNGSFEDATGGQWNNDTFLGGDARVVEDSTAPNGGKSLYFDSSATKEANWYTFTLDVDKNTDYVFSAWVKGAYIADDNRFNASIGVLNPSTRKYMIYEDYKNRTSLEGMQIYPPAWDEEWHLRGVSFNSGNQTQITIGLYGSASKLWVDDMALFKKAMGVKYVSANGAAQVTASNTTDDYCATENSLTENVQISDSDSDYWQTGSGWRNGFMSVESSKVGYGPSLKYEARNPSGIYYIKWVDVKPNTQYVFSASVKVLESGEGALRLMDDKMAKPAPFFSTTFDKAALGEEWCTVSTAFNSSAFTRIGIAVCNKGGAALLDNIRLFESQYATEGEDEYVEREPLNGWVEENGKWVYYEDDVMVTDRWIRDSDGWCYVDETGARVTNAWVDRDGGPCYVGENGYVVEHVWVAVDGVYYYVTEGGQMTFNSWMADGDNCRYLGADGAAYQSAWKKIDGKWYYFNDKAYIVTNKWVRDSVGWCYLGADGVAVTNCWKQDSVGWCYLNGDGSMTKNAWVKDNGKWYFLDQNGYMVSSTWKKDSKGWCYLGTDGAMKTNAWVKDSVGWCYVGDNGYAVTNCWKKDSVGWCYLNGSGSMTKNAWVKTDGKWYYLDKNGYMVTNKWLKDSKGWVYVGGNGAMLTNAWAKDSVGWCYVGDDGYAVTNCWQKDSVGWCYLDENGSMTKSEWVKDNGKWYYLDKNGYMVAGKTVTIDGKKQTFDKNGVWAK